MLRGSLPRVPPPRSRTVLAAFRLTPIRIAGQSVLPARNGGAWGVPAQGAIENVRTVPHPTYGSQPRSRRLSRSRPRVVRRVVRRADARAGAGLARHPRGRRGAAPGAHRLGEDAGGLPGCHRPADVRAGTGTGGAVPRPLCLAPQGAGRGRGAKPARPAGRHPARRGADGGGGDGCRSRPRAHRGHPHRGHAEPRARRLRQTPRRHPGHHARVAVSRCSPAQPARPFDRCGR